MVLKNVVFWMWFVLLQAQHTTDNSLWPLPVVVRTLDGEPLHVHPKAFEFVTNSSSQILSRALVRTKIYMFSWHEAEIQDTPSSKGREPHAAHDPVGQCTLNCVQVTVRNEDETLSRRSASNYFPFPPPSLHVEYSTTIGYIKHLNTISMEASMPFCIFAC